MQVQEWAQQKQHCKASGDACRFLQVLADWSHEPALIPHQMPADVEATVLALRWGITRSGKLVAVTKLTSILRVGSCGYWTFQSPANLCRKLIARRRCGRRKLLPWERKSHEVQGGGENNPHPATHESLMAAKRGPRICSVFVRFCVDLEPRRWRGRGKSPSWPRATKPASSAVSAVSFATTPVPQ